MKKIIYLLALLLIPFVSFASFDVNLKYGARGEAVVDLQDFLKDEGFYAGKVDGKFGLGTLKGVKAWQSTNSLRADGFFGPLSRTKANENISIVLAASDSQEQEETGTVAEPTEDEIKKKINDILAQFGLLKTQLETQNQQLTQQNTKLQQQVQLQQQIVENTKPVVVPQPDEPVYTKPLTAVMTYHPNLSKPIYMYSLGHSDCQNGRPASCIPVGESRMIDGLTFNFQNTTEQLTAENYLKHGYKIGETVILNAFTVKIDGVDIDTDLSGIKFLINGSEKQITRNGNTFSFSGSVELTNDLGIAVWAKINPQAVGKNLQITFTSINMTGKTTGLSIQMEMPQSGRNYTVIQ